jgi:ABC-type lipoprotein release transport system permease subunit
VDEAKQLRTTFGFKGSGQDLSPTAFGRPQVIDAEASTTASEVPVFEKTEGLPPRFTDEELKSGSVLQAALVLEPGASSEAVSERIQALAGERKLPLALATWEQVGGYVSGALGMSRVLLVVLALLLGGFVLLVSTGTLLLLARERVGEVGTLRAVGMQRRQIFVSLLLEGLLLGGVGGFAGSGLGAALVRWGARDGLPVRDETLQFFLGGAVLYPGLDAWQVVGVGLGVMAVMVAAGLVPAWRGSAVTPIVAMRRRED